MLSTYMIETLESVSISKKRETNGTNRITSENGENLDRREGFWALRAFQPILDLKSNKISSF
jgi:hypothetical protein